MKRGNIVLASGPGDFARKPRPFLVVQSDAFNAAHASISLCPLTSMTGENAFFRIALEATGDTGLDKPSEVQVDKLQSLRRSRIERIIGAAPASAMRPVDEALRRWLSL